MKHWKTTVTGALLVVGALANAGAEILQGRTVNWQGTLAAVVAGIGLISAADAAAVTSITGLLAKFLKR